MKAAVEGWGEGEKVPVYDCGVDFGGGEVGVVDLGWFVGSCIFVGEFWENPLFACYYNWRSERRDGLRGLRCDLYPLTADTGHWRGKTAWSAKIRKERGRTLARLKTVSR